MDWTRRALALLTLNSLAAVAFMRGRLAGDVAEAAVPPGTGGRAGLRRHFPNVVLTDQHGREHRFYDDLVKNRKVVINFMYTECSDTCPRTTANLVQLQNRFGDRFGRDVFFLSLSLTPERDTPQRLTEYARGYNVRPGWSFLTGKMDDIDRVRRAIGMYNGPDITEHIGLLTYGNEREGKWGATPTLSSTDQIYWAVTRRIDPFVAQPWPATAAEREL
jgi:protein SCO1/2